MAMGWLSGVRLDRYKLAQKDADRVRAIVNWCRTTGIRVPKPKDVPQQMPEVNCDAMRISIPHLVLQGQNDTALLQQSYTDLKEVCVDITIIEVTNANHWQHHKVPEELYSNFDLVGSIKTMPVANCQRFSNLIYSFYTTCKA